MPDGIDIADGRMFWSDMGNPKRADGAIYSAKMDGSDVKKLISDGQIVTPKQLITDEDAKKIYFCDREGGRVFRCDLDGKNLEPLIQTADYRQNVLAETDWCVGVTISKKHRKVSKAAKPYASPLLTVLAFLDAEGCIEGFGRENLQCKSRQSSRSVQPR